MRILLIAVVTTMASASNVFGAALQLSSTDGFVLTGSTVDILVTLDTPAEAGGTVVTFAVSPGNGLSLPAMVTIPQGNTTGVVQATVDVFPGEAIIFATSSLLVGDNLRIKIVEQINPPTVCKDLAVEAKDAALTYVAAVRSVKQLCKLPGANCTAVLSQASDAFTSLTVTNAAMADGCP